MSADTSLTWADVENVEIDWEARFHKAVSDGIRGKVALSEKLRVAQLDLDQANREIATLQAKVRELTPAGERLAKAEADAQEAAEKWAKHVRDRDNKIAALGTQISRGHRGAMEDVIAWMTKHAERLPKPDPEREVELAPEPPEDFVVGS